MRHIHLDPVGGIAGDMFVAALLDTFPDLTGRVMQALRQSGLDDSVEVVAFSFSDGVLTGTRFKVSKGADEAPGAGAEDHHHHPGDHHHHHDTHEAHSHDPHDHTHWAALHSDLEASSLPEGVKRHAIGIFTELAQAEAQVHGKAAADVTFHEVGNWDSIADIVAAAALIDALAPAGWSVGSLPIGRGRVKTAHGDLPVPAPATSLLLQGFSLHDDGRDGERVTPTGAAILRYLAPAASLGSAPRVLRASGHGFGTRRLLGMSNVLRVLAFEESAAGATTDTVAVIRFEIDDQNGEELAVALDHLRAVPGVIDVTQGMALGKKGRMMASVQVLAQPQAMEAVCDACFRQTTTLGLRTRIEARRILARREVQVGAARVKLADRPGDTTAKTEMDDVAALAEGHAARAAARQAAVALAQEDNQHD
ncbi:LarC family nickel insertion protein [Albidovulum sp.]|uniref:LarC family nickel insertion protein n=1 Tax=Albidovulum sp. TaxID=1872424 RepID=UPI0039B9919A